MGLPNMTAMYEDSIREEFTRQTDSFAGSAAMSAAAVLGTLVEMVPADPVARWLDLACGPGLVSLALAPRVGSVQGVDLTPAMVERAGAEARARGLENVGFGLGDATALEEADGSFDGAITRFSLHHIPVPSRVLAEMARVVRPGGLVVIGDHLTDEIADAAAWHQEIERLRDPTHWASQTPARLRAMGEETGLALEEERVAGIELDFEEWLSRGSGGATAAALIEQLLARPAGSECFRVLAGDEGRRLQLRYWLSRWRRPEES
jgi:SAM-dependent methyltransferase